MVLREATLWIVTLFAASVAIATLLDPMLDKAPAIGLLAAGPLGLVADWSRHPSPDGVPLLVLAGVFIAGPTLLALFLKSRAVALYSAAHWAFATWGVYTVIYI